MNCHFLVDQGHVRGAADLAEVARRQARSLALLDRGAALQVGQARRCSCRYRRRWCRAARTARCSERSASAGRCTVPSPAGAKLPPNILISARNGSVMVDSVSFAAREDALEGDDEIQHQVGRHVFVRLAATGRVRPRCRIHRRVGSRRRTRLDGAGAQSAPAGDARIVRRRLGSRQVGCAGISSTSACGSPHRRSGRERVP